MLGEGDVNPFLHLKKWLKLSDETGYVLQQTTVGVNVFEIFPGNHEFCFLF